MMKETIVNIKKSKSILRQVLNQSGVKIADKTQQNECVTWK